MSMSRHLQSRCSVNQVIKTSWEATKALAMMVLDADNGYALDRHIAIASLMEIERNCS